MALPSSKSTACVYKNDAFVEKSNTDLAPPRATRAKRYWLLMFLLGLVLGCAILGGIMAGVIGSSSKDGEDEETTPLSYTMEEFIGSFDATRNEQSFQAKPWERMIQDVYGLSFFNDRVKHTSITSFGRQTDNNVSVVFVLKVTQPGTQSREPDVGFRSKRAVQLFHIKASDLRYAFLQSLPSYLNSGRFSDWEKSLASRIDTYSLSVVQAVTSNPPTGSTTISVSAEPQPSVTISRVSQSPTPSNESTTSTEPTTSTTTSTSPTPTTVTAKPEVTDVKLWSDNKTVLVNTSGQWGTICSDHWTHDEASAVCRQLGYLHGYRNFTAGSRNHTNVLHDVRCKVDATSLQQCSYKAAPADACRYKKPARVTCTDELRPEFSLRDDGVVHMYYNGTTAPLLARIDNSVLYDPLCKSMGYLEIKSRPEFHQQRYNQTYWIATINSSCPRDWEFYRCLVDEKPKLIRCDGYGSPDVRCNFLRAVLTVYCTATPARLTYSRINEPSETTMGNVQLYRDGRWYGVCHDDITQSAADVICRDIKGSSTAAALRLPKNVLGHEGSLLRGNASCNSQDVYVTSADCISLNLTSKHDCFPEALICYDGQKPNGSTTVWKSSGRVLVKRYGLWGTVCSDNWTSREATLLCKHQGKQSAWNFKELPPSNIDYYAVPMWVLSVNCTDSDEFKDCDVKLTDDSEGAEGCESGLEIAFNCHLQ